jgi:heme o synthase
MMNTTRTKMGSFSWRSYYELCKPNVVALMLLTAIVGMYMSTAGWVPLNTLFSASLGIGMISAAGAALNHICDWQYDALMHRTKYRPLPSGHIALSHALIFAFTLMIGGTFILILFVNTLTAWLTVLTMVGYAGVYTLFLKHATPQNIVIGGAAGAAPPLLGWTAVTGTFDSQALLLVLIIFTWTPPHFWALAIHRHKEYQKAGIPMLPVTHGLGFTKLYILLYTLLLFAVTLLPYAVGMSGLIYLLGSVVLGCIFIVYAVRLMFFDKNLLAMKTFRYSILYLMLLFVLLLFDHHLKIG